MQAPVQIEAARGPEVHLGTIGVSPKPYSTRVLFTLFLKARSEVVGGQLLRAPSAPVAL